MKAPILKLLDSRMTVPLIREPEYQPEDGVFMLNDEEWGQFYATLNPMQRYNVDNVGFNKYEYNGHEYQCMGYKKYPVLKESSKT